SRTLRPTPSTQEPNASSHTHPSDPAKTAKVEIRQESPKKAFGPTYEQIVAYFNQPGNRTPGNEMTFAAIDDAVERGPVLVGSPQQIAEKVLWFHEAFGHDLQSFSLPTVIPHEQQLAMLERFASEVIPVVRKGCPDDSVER
ncbi:hypothetical protein ACFYX0_47145, partial [Streptomyces sp. NPDC002573]